ncbi:hypothetical protein J2X69_003488 [Algoriphagus sp. 4150]|nr:hypothetical protein [Algoriphagus sp. 4150]
MLIIEKIKNQYKILRIEILNKSFAGKQGKTEGEGNLYFEKIKFSYIFYLRYLKNVKLNIVSLKIRF